MNRTAITVNRPREEVERLWESPERRPEHIAESGATVTFKDAPGDRGTEIHVDLGDEGGGIGGVAKRLTGGGAPPLAKVKDDLRRFKALVETGVIARSDGVPEGELAERKLKQRPAQPLAPDEVEKAGAA
jgi:uncharacterized membrane protein